MLSPFIFKIQFKLKRRKVPYIQIIYTQIEINRRASLHTEFWLLGGLPSHKISVCLLKWHTLWGLPHKVWILLKAHIPDLKISGYIPLELAPRGRDLQHHLCSRPKIMILSIVLAFPCGLSYLTTKQRHIVYFPTSLSSREGIQLYAELTWIFFKLWNLFHHVLFPTGKGQVKKHLEKFLTSHSDMVT